VSIEAQLAAEPPHDVAEHTEILFAAVRVVGRHDAASRRQGPDIEAYRSRKRGLPMNVVASAAAVPVRVCRAFPLLSAGCGVVRG